MFKSWGVQLGFGVSGFGVQGKRDGIACQSVGSGTL